MSDAVARVGLGIVLVVALVAVGLAGWQAVALRGDVRALSDELAGLRIELGDVRAETRALGERADALEESPVGGDLGSLLDGLLGGSGDDAGGDDAGAGGLGDLLEGLLGGGLGDAGGLADALGGAGLDLPGVGAFDPTACPPSGSADVERVTATTLDGQVEEVTAAVAAIRGLPAEEVEYEVLDGDEVGAEIERILAEEYPASEADADARTLTLLGGLEPDTDLLQVQRDLLTGQVAGFYDTDTRELVVRDEDGALDAEGISALAHELTHALGDAALGLDVDEPSSADAAAARSALVEGDAVLTQLHFGLTAVNPLSALQGGDPAAAAEAQAALDDAPPFVSEQLIYPYTYGLGFVCGAFGDGGWDAVDALYDDGPTTTAEILFPERLGAPVAAPPAPPAPGTGWREARTDVLGAFDLLALMAAPGGDRSAALDRPLQRAAAWGGSTSVLWTRGEESTLGVALNDTGEGVGLCATLAEHYEAAFPDAEVRRDPDGDGIVAEGREQSAVLACEGDAVRLGIGPDVATARRVAAAG